MTVAFVYAQELRNCLETALEAQPFPTPAQICLRGGEQVRPSISTVGDECCSGLAWVRIMGSEPRFTEADNLGECLGALTRTRFELGVARCMPTPDADEMVTCEQWSEVVARMESDHSAMEAAICCFIDLAQTHPLGSPQVYRDVYTPIGPDGRCIQGTLELTIVHGCSCGTDG